ncbi:hypothetical protein [Embleya scabrispora]|uniref:hypothetical protein n=1 Tax=Embleya scabrispora TaxID=159449 RepID=UPI0003A6F409|nr:hypothetical protein [Embleya scabrispora]MYS87814.1 hypothetical protein [Streptomyces sp. SID5474]
MHGRALKIVITESHSGGCREVATDLTRAGHTVLRCHEKPGADTEEPCVAWTAGRGCPLLAQDVDVVVDVRADAGPQTVREQGAVCALVAGVPLVVCGPVDARGGLLARADVLCRREDIEAACHAAFSPVGPTAHRVVTRAVALALAGVTAPADVHVDLTARESMVLAEVTVGASPTATAFRRVRGAVRLALAPFTPTWPYTPVVLYHRTSTADHR